MWGNRYFKYPFEILAMVQGSGLMGSGLGSAWLEILRLSSHCFDYA